MVSDIQRRLAERGYDPGPVNGQRGEQARNAALEFQRDAGLAETGVLNQALLDALKAQIVGGADASCDTLGEIQRILQDGTSGLQALAGAVSNRVRVDAPQPLTAAQQWQARQNIGAADGAQIGDPQTDFVGIFQGALR